MAGRGRLWVGCSGWQYRHWRGDFYPSNVPTSRWLDHYAQIFDTVELNNSFYRLPPASTFRRWRERTPAGFCFAVKASRYLTHNRRLIDPEEPLRRLWSHAGDLREKLGPMLYQLPPRWKRDAERLERFLAAARRPSPQAVEFRDKAWYDEETYAALEAAGVALCIHDMAGSEAPRRVTAGFVYLRFHGSGARYGGAYGRERLLPWTTWVASQLDAGRDVYAYFNNDVGGHAPRDALLLRELIPTAR
jgi:uncharacterized protein YecE (DUF72 family)